MALALLQEMRLFGPVGERIDALTAQWLLPAPSANPGLSDALLRKREGDAPGGDYFSRYLVGAILIFRMHRDARLRAQIESLLSKLYESQDADGCLGAQAMGSARDDLWTQYQGMLALYLWHKTTNSLPAFSALTRAAQYVLARFSTKETLETLHRPEDFAVLHALALLYRATGEEEMRAFCRRLGARLAETEGAESLLAHIERTPLSAWRQKDARLLCAADSLYTFWHYTRESSYARVLYAQYRLLRQRSRLPNGGFGDRGRAVGDPYGAYAAETCSTVQWAHLCSDALRATRDSGIADELELTMLNAGLGALRPSGRGFFRFAAMEGKREEAAGVALLPGAPEFSCCAADGPRLLGLLSQWGVFADGDEVFLSDYCAGTTVLQLDSGRLVRIVRTTDYPRGGRVQIEITAQRALKLHLRIPAWSRETALSVNGHPLYEDKRAGTFFALELPAGTAHLLLELDLSLHFWEGEGASDGRHAVYRGPVLLAFDRWFNPDFGPQEEPVFDVNTLRPELYREPPFRADPGALPPLLRLGAVTRDGRPVTLCAYADAGQRGTAFTAWLHVRRAPAGSVWR